MLQDIVLIIIAFAVGIIIGRWWGNKTRHTLRDIIAQKDRSITGLNEDRASLQADHSELGQKHGELGNRFTQTERELGRAKAEIERLKPDAEYGRDMRAKQKKASQAGVAARLAKSGAAPTKQPSARVTPPRQSTKPVRKTAKRKVAAK